MVGKEAAIEDRTVSRGLAVVIRNARFWGFSREDLAGILEFSSGFDILVVMLVLTMVASDILIER